MYPRDETRFEMTSMVNEGLIKASLDITMHSVDTQAFAVSERQPFEVTLNFGAANADEVAALASFTSIIKVVFAQMLGIDVSKITVSFMEITSASAVLIAFSATGSALSMTTISESSTQVTGPFNQESVKQGLSYTVSSVSANVAEGFSVMFAFRCRVVVEVPFR